MALILGIESSCDETSMALIEDGKILANVISSQIDTFKDYGGVVPEIASRLHEQNFPFVFDSVFKEANKKPSDVSAVAITKSPGLIGCLQVGMQVAKTFALNYNIPIIGVHHIAGHIYGANIDNEFKYPLLALVISGGHTELIYIRDEMQFEIIGQTQDDAIGETYDKVARVLGLEYPGGPLVDKLAHTGNASIEFPIAKLEGEFDFSYSGLKSAVVNYVHNQTQKGNEIKKEDVAASFQKYAVEQLFEKTKAAISKYKPNQLVIAGGVSANSQVREMAKRFGIEVLIPSLKYCTDNAAMIAKVGEIKFKNKQFDNLELMARPSERIDR